MLFVLGMCVGVFVLFKVSTRLPQAKWDKYGEVDFWCGCQHIIIFTVENCTNEIFRLAVEIQEPDYIYEMIECELFCCSHFVNALIEYFCGACSAHVVCECECAPNANR